MKTRRRIGLAVVIGCGVVVSFSGLYSLAIACKFPWALAVLVPVLADAGAAVAADHWFDTSVPKRVRRYAMVIALVLISSSVAGNAASHLLVAFNRSAPWWLVVVVAALAPGVVASNLHLSSLVRAGGERGAEDGEEPPVAAVMLHDEVPALGVDWPQPPAIDDEVAETVAPGLDLAPVPDVDATESEEDVLAKARELAAAGVGRPTLVKELGLKEHVARAIVEKHKPRQEAPA